MRIFKDWLIGIVCLVIMGGGVSVMKGSKQLFFVCINNIYFFLHIVVVI